LGGMMRIAKILLSGYKTGVCMETGFRGPGRDLFNLINC